MSALSPTEFRSNFPGLERGVHLASCSQGALSRELSGQLLDFQSSIVEHGAPWGLWMAKVEQARKMFAEFIGASVDEVAIVSSASEGAFQVASTQYFGVRDGIVTTDLEFPSIAHVWLAQGRNGAKVHHVPERNGVVDVADYAALIDDRTKLVSVPLITYRNGSRLPVAEVIELARQHGAKTFIDAYQGAGVERINVKELGCDYLVSGTLKYMLGISGIAFLYVRNGVLDDLPPELTGWFGRKDPFEFDPRNLDFPLEARRFEAGTPSVPSAYGAVAGMKMLQMLDYGDVQRHVSEMTGLLDEELRSMGCKLDSPADPRLRGPQVALLAEDPNDLGEFLKARGVVASPRGAVLRLSVHYYNVEEDIRSVVSAIREYGVKYLSATL